MDKFVNRRIPQIGYDTDFISRTPFHLARSDLCIGERVEILGRSSDSASSKEEIGDYRGKEIRSEMQTMMILKEVSCWSTSNNFNCRLWRGLRIRVDQAIAGGERDQIRDFLRCIKY